MAKRRETARFGIGILVGLVLTTGTSFAIGDIAWKRHFRVVEGRLSRDLTGNIQVAIIGDPSIATIPVRYSIVQGGTTFAQADTLIPAARRSRETVFTLPVPALDRGVYALRLQADPLGTIAEKDEDNNAVSYNFTVPDGSPVRIRCEGPEASVWEIQRVELNAQGYPYPDDSGTVPDTTHSSRHVIAVGGVEPGHYSGILFGPSVNRLPMVISSGTFVMPGPSVPMDVVWPRTTPYMTSRPKVKGTLAGETVGGESAAPLWEENSLFLLESTIRNPTDHSADIQWLIRFQSKEGAESAVKDTTLTIGALATEHIGLSGRVPQVAGKFFLQAEVRIPWPSGFEDIGEEERVASHIFPVGWIEIQR